MSRDQRYYGKNSIPSSYNPKSTLWRESADQESARMQDRARMHSVLFMLPISIGTAETIVKMEIEVKEEKEFDEMYYLLS